MNTRFALMCVIGMLAVGGIAFAATKPASPPAASAGNKPAAPSADNTMMAADAPGMAPGMAPAAGAAPALTVDQTQFFENKVRPILSEKCYKCHAVDAQKIKGGLVLDSREGLLKGGENGAVVVPGDALKSRLIVAVQYTDADLQMPPKGEKLTDQQIADLTAWVNMGAPDPRGGAAAPKLTGLTDKARAHWAYQPVVCPAIPAVKNTAWIKTPVDAFVLAKLEANGLSPSKPALKEALIRRAYYDMIGLPPTPEELETFQRDRSPNAWEKVVDSLLASPHYGERWGRFWLDSARYADTTGAEQVRREDYRYAYAWTYRDWVVKAFNSDMPYDQFLMKQLAADELPATKKADPKNDDGGNSEDLAALGFLTVGKRFANVNDTIDERIDTVSKAMLGMTVSCARCHDHKFDPIPQMDYYSLHGVFNSIQEPEEKPLIGKQPSQKEVEAFQQKMAELEEKDREIYFKIVTEKGAEFRRKAGAYVLAKLYSRKNEAADLLERNRLVRENNLDRGILQGLKLRGDVFAPIREFVDFGESDWKDRVQDAFNDITQRENLNPFVRDAFKNTPVSSVHSMKDVTDIYGRLFESIAPKASAYITACRESKDGKVEGFEPALIELLDDPAPIEPANQITTDHLRDLLPQLPLVNNRAYNDFMFGAINVLEMTNPASPARAMVVSDLPHPHDDPVFIRGEANNRGPIAPRRFLEILSGKDREPFRIGSGRLELAQCIANRNNPMTARVMINRIWMHHFGDGFVRTPDDLGVQSEAPSHPELLDYLASQFMDNGWDIKKIHKLILMSNAYQQSSDTNLVYAQKDPENRLLWRANLRRLDFEAIRDTLLMFTGNLDPSIGGKPVNLTDEPYSYRRSIYGYIDRGALPELMSQFDFSDPDRANSRRTSTIVPQQALFFMNSPMAADVARKAVSRPEFLAATNDPARVKALYLLLFQREPKATEVRLAADFFNAHDRAKIQITEAPQSRKSVTADKPREKGKKRENDAKKAIQNEGELVDRKPLTLWEEYTQALLFTNEVAYVN